MKQDYLDVPIRSAATLTNSFVAGTVIGDDNTTGQTLLKNQLMLYVEFTVGSLDTAEIRIEFSPDNVTFYREVETANVATNLATENVFDHSLPQATANFRLAIPIKDRFIRVSARGVGTVTSSSMTIRAVVGIA